MEVMNPGRLPIGVTTANILHKTKRRNDGLARIFHDLKLMEREGTGFDKIYEVLLSQGRKPPVPTEGTDFVMVCVERRLMNPRVIRLLSTVNAGHELTQREKICLGLLGLGDGMTAKELCAALELETAEALRPWIGRSMDRGLIKSSGKTTALRYFVAPELFNGSPIAKTTLRRIEPHRLEALIEEDLKRYPQSALAKVHERTCPEIPVRAVKSALDRMKARGVVTSSSKNCWCRYAWIANQGGNSINKTEG